MDDFNRANGAPGANWNFVDLESPSSDPVLIVSNELKLVPEISRWVGWWTPCIPSDDADVIVTIPRAGTGGSGVGAVGAAGRGDNADTFYDVWHNMNGNSFLLREVTAGTPATLDTGNFQNAYPFQVGISFNGTTIKGWYNIGGGWVEDLSAVDATLTGGRAGLFMSTQGWGPPSGSNVYLEDFAAGDLGDIIACALMVDDKSVEMWVPVRFFDQMQGWHPNVPSLVRPRCVIPIYKDLALPKRTQVADPVNDIYRGRPCVKYCKSWVRPSEAQLVTNAVDESMVSEHDRLMCELKQHARRPEHADIVFNAFDAVADVGTATLERKQMFVDVLDWCGDMGLPATKRFEIADRLGVADVEILPT